MKKSVVLVLLILVFFSLGLGFLYCMVEEFDFVFLIPFIVGVFGVLLLSIMLFLGEKSYDYDSEKLYIKRIVKVIEKGDVKNLCFVYDSVLENLHIICFRYGNRRYYVDVQNNGREVAAFFDGMEHENRKNGWYYLIEFFIV